MRRLPHLILLLVLTATGLIAPVTLAGAHVMPRDTVHGSAPGSPTQIPSSPTSPCLNGDCPAPGVQLTYNGGPLLSAPVIYLVRFSDSRDALSPAGGFTPHTFDNAAPNAASAALATVNSDASWWRSEYSTPAYPLGSATFGGVVTLVDPALADQILVSDTAISNELSAAIASGELPSHAQAIYVTFLRLGQIDYIGSLTQSNASTFCAYHSFNAAQTFTYAVIPNNSTMAGCHSALVSAAASTPFDAITSVISHEVTETITDPYQSGWYAPQNTPATSYSAGQEISDLCAGGGLLGTDPNGTPVTYLGSPYVLQLEYSNAAQGCLSLPLQPQMLLTTTPGGLSARIYSAGEGVGNVPVTLTTAQGTLSSVTNNVGVATFALTTAPGDVVRAVSGDLGGVAGSAASLVVAPPSTPLLSVTQDQLVSPAAPVVLAVQVAPTSAGTVYAFGPFGQLLAATVVVPGAPVALSLSSATMGDEDQVVFVTSGGSSASTTVTIAPTASMHVSVATPVVAENGASVTVTISPAEAGVTVYAYIDGVVVLTRPDQTTNAQGQAVINLNSPVLGSSPVAIYAVTPHAVLSTYLTLDYRMSVGITGVSWGVGRGTFVLSDASGFPTVGVTTRVRIGSSPSATYVTDSNGSVVLHEHAAAGQEVFVSWPTTSTVLGGHVSFYTPGALSATWNAFVHGALVSAQLGGNFLIVCAGHAQGIHCSYSSFVPGSGHVTGLGDVRTNAHQLLVKGRVVATLRASDVVSVVLDEGVTPRYVLEVSRGSHVIWRS